MLRRLLVITVPLLVALVAALGIPLASAVVQRETQTTYLDRLGDASRFASLAESGLQSDRLEALSQEIQRYDALYDVPVALVSADQRIVLASRLGFDPTDDPEERLAIFRAMSNVVSTRSDVFTAWFVIRGYDPERIETTSVSGDPEEAFNRASMRPTFEQRWMAVFDRSNVSRPTDRPHVLLLVQLPTDEPLFLEEPPEPAP